MTEPDAKSIKVGQFFSLFDFLRSNDAVKHGIMANQLSAPKEVVARIQYLCAEILDRVTNQVGRITISSGWRSSRLNEVIGGAPTSAHLTGEAADFQCEHLKLAFDYIKNRLFFDQLIMERKGSDDKGWIYWIHVSKKITGHNRGQAFYMSNGKVSPKFDVK